MEKDLVTVFIPRKNKYDTERYVCVNCENMLVQTGKPVQVPRRFASVIKRSIKSDASAEAYIAENCNRN